MARPYEKNKQREKPKAMVKEYEVKGEAKLLEFLFATITGTSKNNIKALLKNKQISVNGKGVTQFDHPLKPKDIVSVHPAPIQASGERESKLEIIYEDEEFLVIHKPSGLLSVEDTKEKEKTAFHWMTEYVKQVDPKARLYVLHRIDKETSGVLVFCKKEDTKEALQEQWNEIVTVREYEAICEGYFKEKEGTITSYLTQGKNGLVYSTKNPREGQKAITHYQVLAEKNGFSLVKVSLDTGRKNQIRVHMRELGHSVVGDKKYEAKQDPIHRLGLHNRVLEFTLPKNKKKYTFVAETPKEFEKLFKR